jgi:hypothetical protein
VKGKGWPSLQSDNWSFDDKGDGETLRTSLRMLEAGDVLLLPTVASISERPSIQERTLLGLIARGVRVHVLSLGGSIEPHLLALREAWDATLPLEQERDAIERRAELREKQLVNEQSEWETEIVARMAERFGVSHLFDGETTPETTIGTYVRTQREARGWTQQELAERASTSKAQVSRVEREGKGEALQRILAALADPSSAPEVKDYSFSGNDRAAIKQPAIGA